jgi:hypothetical protein
MEETPEKTVGHLLRLGLLLLGSFAIAYNAGIFLHEACHALAAVACGGRVFGISLHPFGWSHSYSLCPGHPVFHGASGTIGASLIALFVYVVLIRWPKAWLMAALLLAPATLLTGGEYWLVDILYGSNGDACRLIDRGVPSSVVTGTGAVLFVVGFILAVHLMRAVGIANQGFRVRLAVLLVGTLPYAAAELTWNWFHARSEFGMWLIYFLSETGLVIVIAVVAGFFPKKKQSTLSPGWTIVGAINLLAVGLIVALLAASAARAGAQPRVQVSSTRPDGFPDVLVPHPDAAKVTYVVWPLGCILSYSLPEQADANDVLDDLAGQYRAHGYRQLRYELDDPAKPIVDGWTNEVYTFRGETLRKKEREQRWMKLSPCIRRLSVSCSRPQDGSAPPTVTASVNRGEAGAVQIRKILAYADAHPEAFDPNEIEQVKGSVGSLVSEKP